MSYSDCEIITRLTQALDRSVEFYSEAAEAATAAHNAAIFDRISKARTAILTYLTPFTLHNDDCPDFYAFGSALQKVYPDMLAELQYNADPALVSISRQNETDLCDLIKLTLEQTQSSLLCSLLVDLFPELNGVHPMCLFDHAS